MVARLARDVLRKMVPRGGTFGLIDAYALLRVRRLGDDTASARIQRLARTLPGGRSPW